MREAREKAENEGSKRKDRENKTPIPFHDNKSLEKKQKIPSLAKS
jgi:hypothetical protein